MLAFNMTFCIAYIAWGAEVLNLQPVGANFLGAILSLPAGEGVRPRPPEGLDQFYVCIKNVWAS